MADIITSVSTAITIAKRLNEISKNIQDAEFKNLLADLSLELADTKLKLSEIIIENSDLKEKISNIEHSKGLGEKLQVKDGMYYSDSGDGPFCTACYDSNGKKILANQLKGNFARLARFSCPHCKATYQ